MTTDTRNNSNGRVAAEDLLHTMSPGNRSRIFVSPGKDTLELLMRTVFKDESQAAAAVLLYDKCVKYNFARGLDDLRAYLAAKCSLQGRSTALALMAETGVVAPGVLSDDKTIKKAWQRNKQKPDTDN